jgi:hypothetical protein
MGCQHLDYIQKLKSFAIADWLKCPAQDPFLLAVGGVIHSCQQVEGGLSGMTVFSQVLCEFLRMSETGVGS